eukprot:gene38812-51018_t
MSSYRPATDHLDYQRERADSGSVYGSSCASGKSLDDHDQNLHLHHLRRHQCVETDGSESFLGLALESASTWLMARIAEGQPVTDELKALMDAHDKRVMQEEMQFKGESSRVCIHSTSTGGNNSSAAVSSLQLSRSPGQTGTGSKHLNTGLRSPQRQRSALLLALNN